MADARDENKFISKENSGFPDYLDWEKLRIEGRDYLGKLAGNIWTDHNEHDPGITILEILCYAILDLGYKTNLPVADILSRNPLDTGKDNNFFSSSELLACNPVTITDFRKLLIDIDGVRNAWLHDSFYDCNDADYKTQQQYKETKCSDCYNGLYRVYVEIETRSDNPQLQKQFEDEVLVKIKKQLMSHRNLCEDFIDITILCRQKIGLCADIELEAGINVETAYKEIVERLQEFFSPAPKFYTLIQLLEEKKKNIEDIFAGRPYDIKESHGFVDTGEFEQIKLKKEIHLSDVYQVILNVKGVRQVRNLALRDDCAAVSSSDWVLPINQNHIPYFNPNPECSTINFTRNGLTVSYDPKKLSRYFEFASRHNGKVLYKIPSLNLVTENPKGNFINDLSEYKSVINEFPQVYGIREGGLPSNASDERKAKARQLQAYLLFFDQLLANYLSQLNNVRSLFALNSSEEKKERHTYFLNQLRDIPEFEKLIRFKIKDGDSSTLGSEGIMLAKPVSKSEISVIIKKDKSNSHRVELNDCNIKFGQYDFCDLNECAEALNTLMQDLLYGGFKPEIYSTKNDCWFFYYETSSGEFDLISSKFYGSERDARQAAASLHYVGTFIENYRTYLSSDSRFTFSLELNLSGYDEYLYRIIEDENSYTPRRQEFLNHLLARFAERFTDFAMLSYGFLKENELRQKDNERKENFLTHYDDLSANRGRGYDYKINGWNNDNVSGFEKRVAAIAGIEKFKNQSLCNFVVEEKDIPFVLNIKLGDVALFKGSEKFPSEETAEAAVKSLLQLLSDKENYKAVKDKGPNWRVRIGNEKQHLIYHDTFENEADAELATTGIHRLFSHEPPADDVFVSKTVFKIILYDNEQNETGTLMQNFEKQKKAVAYLPSAIKQISKLNKWQFKEGFKTFEKISAELIKEGEYSFIDLSAFKINIDDDIVDKPDKFQYELLDNKNSFKFNSVIPYDSIKEAEAACLRLLNLLTYPDSSDIGNSESGKFIIQVKANEEVIAVSDTEYETKNKAREAAKKITDLIKQHQYFAVAEERPYRWKFNFRLGYDKDNQYTFNSTAEFENPEAAKKASIKFYNSFDKSQLKHSGNRITLKENRNELEHLYFAGAETNETIANLHRTKREALKIGANSPAEDIKRFIEMDVTVADALYVYRLVDKDNLHAVYLEKDFDSCTDADKERKEIFSNLTDPAFAEICLGGDIIHERKNPVTGIKWYHYQLVSKRAWFNDAPLALFESVQGYASKEEAIKAFDENYLLVLEKALDVLNYGEDLFISSKEIYEEGAGNCSNGKLKVFIPALLSDYFGGDFELIKKKLSDFAVHFPVRIITKDNDDFYTRFHCLPDERNKNDKADCAEKTNIEKYFYFVLSTDAGVETWQSVNYFNSAAAAFHRFHFFLLLLRYSGNYFAMVDYCSCHNEEQYPKHDCKCKWKIYIREVLAESKKQFPGEVTAPCQVESAAAWKAIEKFICVSQTEKAFHTYQDKDCYYSFNVACDILGFIHPCKYDTPEKRDRAADQLYKSYREYAKYGAHEVISTTDKKCVLRDSDGNDFAVIKSDKTKEQDCICFAEIIENLPFDLFDKKSSEVYLKNGITLIIDGSKVTISGTEILKNESWLQKLSEFICYYPVRKRKGRFFIELNLPGFNCCGDDFSSLQPCGCGEQKEITNDECKCCTAWISECCFAKCDEAFTFLRENIECLGSYDNYLPVFDCECGPYGIKLNCSCPETATTQPYQQAETSNLPSTVTISNPVRVQQPVPTLQKNECCNEIIAFNPQQYTTPQMDCEAVARAKRLINAEGFHLVEHILLRPRCEEDCVEKANYNYEKKCIVDICDSPKINCNDWEWKPSGDHDPCDENVPEKKIMFLPGRDPYSFIATIALPAWPERFRKEDNRKLLENLLYRETPAHIMLRILWLTPHDLCAFESGFREWTHWISRDYNHKCIPNPTCDFIDLLFHTPFKCLPQCDACVPCPSDKSNVPVCFEPEEDPCCNTSFRYNTDYLYCWTPRECDPKDIYVQEPKEDVKTKKGDTKFTPVKADARLKAKTIAREKINKKISGTESAILLEEDRNKSAVFNKRFRLFKDEALSQVENPENKDLNDFLSSFFRKQEITDEEFFKVNDIIDKQYKSKNKKPAQERAKNQVKINVLCVCLDKLYMHKVSIVNEKQFVRDFKVLKKKLTPEGIIKKWDYDSLQKLSIGDNHNLIIELLPELKK